jgi:hypothetical protein
MSREANRQSTLSIILPALTIATAYILLSMNDWLLTKTLGVSAAEFKNLQKISEDGRPATIDAAAAHRRRDMVRDLQSRKKHLKDDWERAVAGLTGRQADTRPETMARLTEALVRNGIRILEAGPGNSKTGASESPSVQWLTRRFAPATKAKSTDVTNIMEIRFAGTYRDTLRALRELSELVPEAIPVGITMAGTSFETDLRVWVLRVFL